MCSMQIPMNQSMPLSIWKINTNIVPRRNWSTTPIWIIAFFAVNDRIASMWIRVNMKRFVVLEHDFDGGKWKIIRKLALMKLNFPLNVYFLELVGFICTGWLCGWRWRWEHLWTGTNLNKYPRANPSIAGANLDSHWFNLIFFFSLLSLFNNPPSPQLDQHTGAVIERTAVEILFKDKYWYSSRNSTSSQRDPTQW